MIIWLIVMKTFLGATYSVIDEFWIGIIGARP